MKTNIFSVKEKNNKKIVIEEDNIKNPLLLFFKRNKKTIVMFILMLVLCLLLVSIGIGFSLFRGTNDYEITYITGSEDIGANNNPDIDDEDIEEELLGEIARSDGVVVLVESFLNDNGDVIYYYTDGTAVMITAGGKIYRVSTDKNKNYGVNRNGKIDKDAKKVLVTSTTSTLEDGTIITYYSDGTAMVAMNDKTIFVRDSNNIEIKDGKLLSKVNPSGVALNKESIRVRNSFVNNFTDGTTLITVGGEMFLVNKNVSPIIDNTIRYDRNNIFNVISEKEYSDGNVIRHFSNGSATITDKDGKVIYVRNSGDLKLRKKQLYEIMPNDKGYSRGVVNSKNKSSIVYFDNGSAIVITPDNGRYYVEDADEIIYDTNKNIVSGVNEIKLKSVMVTSDGKKAFCFENGKTQVVNSKNSSYIVDTDSLDLKPLDSDKEEEKVEDEDKDDSDDKEEPDEEEPEIVPIDPGEGIHISEAEHESVDPFDVQSTTFVIKNDSTTNKNLRITIDEINDYSKYNTSRLEPNFVKFQSTVGDDYVPASYLTDNVWVDDNGEDNYVIYDGILKAKTSVTVTISLYVDYKHLDNSHQNKGFLGTIRVYVEG